MLAFALKSEKEEIFVATNRKAYVASKLLSRELGRWAFSFLGECIVGIEGRLRIVVVQPPMQNI